MTRFLLFLLAIAALHAEEAAVAKATPPPRERFLIFLLAGQSNMSGRGTAEAADHEGDAQILVFRDGGWQVAADPLHRDKPKVVGVGPGLAFARAAAASAGGRCHRSRAGGVWRHQARVVGEGLCG